MMRYALMMRLNVNHDDDLYTSGVDGPNQRIDFINN